ncbi:hypothetical protein HLI_19910 [Halobacillus litoralis]|uniref:Uncharacterized protein n=1 Tax=Halobacillus litoralis TaxID=45668 RepID=A0A410MHW5_9BACI|nr:hypothetical protein HLI_19910 [Halobacillus litoralis]
MREWWESKRQVLRDKREGEGRYRFSDFITEVLCWVPELLIFPFRLLYWFVKGIGRLIGFILDLT